MTNTAWLPKLLRWLFTFFVVVMTLGAIAVCVVIVIDPTLPPGTHFGPMKVDFLGQPGSVVFKDSAFALTAFRGVFAVSIQNADGLIEMLKHYGLPLILLRLVFFIVVFELLRRLFRNVGRRESFTLPTLRLVQILRRLASRLLARVGGRRRLVCPCDVCLSGSERADRGFGIAVTPASIASCADYHG